MRTIGTVYLWIHVFTRCNECLCSYIPIILFGKYIITNIESILRNGCPFSTRTVKRLKNTLLTMRFLHIVKYPHSTLELFKKLLFLTLVTLVKYYYFYVEWINIMTHWLWIRIWFLWFLWFEKKEQMNPKCIR